jgi:RecB family exonuclease
LRALTLRRGALAGPRVVTWDELWRAIRAAAPSGPVSLTAAGVSAVLDEALHRCERREGLGPLGGLARTRGLRQHLLARFHAWTRAGLDPEKAIPDGALDGAVRVIYAHYRALLRKLEAADGPAFSAWAARVLRENPPPEFADLDRVVVLDPPPGDPAVTLALEGLNRTAGEMLVTLPADPGCPEAFAAVSRLRQSLLEWGFVETSHELDPSRPAGLAAVERCLFAEGAAPPLSSGAGLSAFGAPQGDGVALTVARLVRDQLAAGTHPEQLAVLVPAWDEGADRIVGTLSSWKLPVRAEQGRTLATEPSLAALLLAAGLPARRWEAVPLVRLLRNSRLRPAWLDERSAAAPAAAARAVVECRAFRELDTIRRALARQADRSAAEGARTEDDRRRRQRRADRAETALRLLEPLSALLNACNAPAPWSDHIDRLRWIGGELGLLDEDETALDQLVIALEDWGAVRAGLGRSGMADWSAFVETAARLARETVAVADAPAGGCIRVATVAAAVGAEFDQVILAGLDEGAFPARDAIELEPDVASATAYSAEMLRFLRVVGAARRGITFVYPTTDEHGQTLLTAGFFDEVRRLVEPCDWGRHDEQKRLDPIQPEPLLGVPLERRVWAVAMASRGEETVPLRRLAGDPRDGLPLEGTAAALRVLARRSSRGGKYSPFEGRMGDPAVARRIVESFGPGRFLLSASQLESLAFCPFQFLARYVLRLEPTDDRDELEEDRSAKGSLLHRALEELHARLRDDPELTGRPLADRVREELPATIQRLVDSQPEPRTEIETSLRAIQAGRLMRDGRRYARQFAEYEAGPGREAACAHCEVAFGLPRESSHPPLEIGPADRGVLIYGVIDRIDVIPRDGVRLFRVIDYKTGHVPEPAELKGGTALQVPLYALAAERLLAGTGGGEPLDAGYWGIGGKGYRPGATMTTVGDGPPVSDARWAAYRDALLRYVIELIERLRAADLPIAPRRDDCTRGCDYKTVCRIHQVRRAERAWPERPTMRIEG